MNQFGSALEFASEDLRANKQVVLAAVSNYGKALMYASDELRADIEIVMIAVTKTTFWMGDGSKICVFGDEALRAQKEKFKRPDYSYWSMSQGGGYLQYASDDIKNNKNVVLAAITNDATALNYASISLMLDEDILNAYLSDGFTCNERILPAEAQKKLSKMRSIS